MFLLSYICLRSARKIGFQLGIILVDTRDAAGRQSPDFARQISLADLGPLAATLVGDGGSGGRSNSGRALCNPCGLFLDGSQVWGSLALG